MRLYPTSLAQLLPNLWMDHVAVYLGFFLKKIEMCFAVEFWKAIATNVWLHTIYSKSLLKAP